MLSNERKPLLGRQGRNCEPLAFAFENQSWHRKIEVYFERESEKQELADLARINDDEIMWFGRFVNGSS